MEHEVINVSYLKRTGLRRVIDDAITQLSNLRHRMDPELIEEAEPVSIIGGTVEDNLTAKGSLAAVLREIVNGHGGSKEKAARELRISSEKLESSLSYCREDDDPLWGPIESSRQHPLEQYSRSEIRRLLREPINFFILENFSRPEWRNKKLNGQMRTVHLTLKVLSKRLAEYHGCFYFGGMTFSRIEWNVYRRAAYIYANHTEAAKALNVDPRTFRKYWEDTDFPCRYTLFTG